MTEEPLDYETIKVRYQHPVCFLQLYRPESKNTINGRLISECHDVLDRYRDSMTVLVIEGLPEMFCFGVDFEEVRGHNSRKESEEIDKSKENEEWNSEPLYDLWLKMASDSYVTIAHVRGKVNAGGMGFIAASDIVIADDTAVFSLSELLFGIVPACVLPFLVRRVGLQKANYMTLTTQSISSRLAYEWGIVDVYGDKSDNLLRKELLRLRGLPKDGIGRYKHYLGDLYNTLQSSKDKALSTNKEVFTDQEVRQRILKFLETGQISKEGQGGFKEEKVEIKEASFKFESGRIGLNHANAGLAELKSVASDMALENGDVSIERSLASVNAAELSRNSDEEKGKKKESPSSDKDNSIGKLVSLEQRQDVDSPTDLSQFPELVQLNRIEEGRPVFWIHAPVGAVTLYTGIAELAERPFYGIQMRGRVANRYPLRGVSAMAAYYVHIILSVQSRGPYDLGGYSGGGIIAYEVTRQLQELGHAVGTVVMLDAVWAEQFEDLKRPSRKSKILASFNSILMPMLSDEDRSDSYIAERQIHRDDVDSNVDESSYFEELYRIAINKGMIKNERLFRAQFEKNTSLWNTFDLPNFTLYPLQNRESVVCYYLRNKNGIYINERRSPYILADKEEMNISHRAYWEIWQKQFDSFHIIDLDATSHMDFFSDPKSRKVILDFCKELYSNSGG